MFVEEFINLVGNWENALNLSLKLTFATKIPPPRAQGGHVSASLCMIFANFCIVANHVIPRGNSSPHVFNMVPSVYMVQFRLKGGSANPGWPVGSFFKVRLNDNWNFLSENDEYT